MATLGSAYLGGYPGAYLGGYLGVAEPIEPPDATDLLEAIWYHCEIDPDLQAAFGRSGWLWRDEAPSGEPLPYAVLLDGEAEPEWESRGRDGQRPYTATRQLQLSVFAISRAEARQLAERIADLLLPAALPFADGYLMGLFPGDAHDLLDPDPGPGGTDVWQRVQMIDAITGHSRDG